MPDFRQLFLGDAQQIKALPTGDLYHRDIVLLRYLGDALQFLWCGDAPIDARHDAEGAITLDVGMHTIVYVPGVTLFFVAVGVDLAHDVGEPYLAVRAYLSSPASLA